MRKKSLILIIPLLVLLLMPSQVFGYVLSDESIIEFAETLEDDVFFAPDSLDYDQQSATAGSAVGATIEGDYTNTSADDSSYYKTSRAGAGLLSITLNFTHSLGQFVNYTQEGNITIDINHNEVASTAEMCYVYNFANDSWDSGVDTSSGDGYYNFTLTTDHIENGLTRVKANETAGAGGSYLWVDYALSSVDCYTKFNDSYVETFSDAEGWITWAGEDDWNSDGDVFTFVTEDSNFDRIYSNAPSLPTSYNGYYVEIRYYCNTSGGDLRIYIYEQDTHTGDFDSFTCPSGAGWRTYKLIQDDSDTTAIESIVINGRYTDKEYKVDYIRIGLSTELGYQHDGSHSGLINSAESYSSDGDLLYLRNLATSPDADFSFQIDSTASKAIIDPDYYPFLMLTISSYTDTFGYGDVMVYVGDSPSGDWLGNFSSAGTYRYNVRAVTASDYEEITIVLAIGHMVYVDLLKSYSIANFSVSDVSDESVSDYAYVESGELVVSSTTADSIIFSHDPVISVTGSIYDEWETALVYGEANSMLGLYNGAWTYFVQGDIANDTLSGTNSDVQYRAYGALRISSICFLDTHDWVDISEADFVLWVPFSAEQEFLFETLLILFGLALMPIGTTYLAAKKDNMTADTFYIGIICILFGFALFVGVIMT